MFELSAHFAGGGGAGSSSENLDELISIANTLISNDKVIWLKIVDTTLGFNVLECTGTTRWHNKFYFMSSEETAIWLEELGEAISLLKEVKS